MPLCSASCITSCSRSSPLMLLASVLFFNLVSPLMLLVCAWLPVLAISRSHAGVSAALLFRPTGCEPKVSKRVIV